MSYSTDAAKLSREALNIVRLDLDTKISGTYEYICDGVSPPNDPPIYPCVKSIEWIPTRTSQDGGLGYLGEVVITAEDFPWFDGVGTYFGRLIANNPYFLNRCVKIYSGFLSRGDTFSLSNFQERDYFIKDIVGPDNKGIVKIKAFDILSQTKEDTIPRSTNGYLGAALVAATTNTSIDVGNNDGFQASGYAIINDEIVSYTSSATANHITLGSRGQGGTTAADHASGDAIRHIEQYSGNITDVVKTIFDNHTDIDTSTYISTADFDAEESAHLSSESIELWVVEPTSVDKVLNDICEQTFVMLFWDDVTQKIKLKAIGPTLTNAVEWNDDYHILEGSAAAKRPQKNIFSQCWVYYGRINKKGSKTDPQNYKSLYILVDNEIETGLGKPNIKRLFCPDLPDSASTTASKISSRFIKQRSNPVEFMWEVDTKDQESLEVGDLALITTDLMQGTDGLPQAINMRVIEKRAMKNNRWRYKAVFTGTELGSRYAVIAPNSVGDYTAASPSEKDTYGFIADTDDEMSNGDDPYLIQ